MRNISVVALLFTLAGCRSNVVVLDERPAWVADAERRLKNEPVFNVDQPKASDSRPLWGQQPAEDAPHPQESSTSRQSRSPHGRPDASPSPTLGSKTSRSPVPQPDAVSWGETKITVEVED